MQRGLSLNIFQTFGTAFESEVPNKLLELHEGNIEKGEAFEFGRKKIIRMYEKVPNDEWDPPEIPVTMLKEMRKQASGRSLLDGEGGFANVAPIAVVGSREGQELRQRSAPASAADDG